MVASPALRGADRNHSTAQNLCCSDFSMLGSLSQTYLEVEGLAGLADALLSGAQAAEILGSLGARVWLEKEFKREKKGFRDNVILRVH